MFVWKLKKYSVILSNVIFYFLQGTTSNHLEGIKKKKTVKVSLTYQQITPISQIMNFYCFSSVLFMCIRNCWGNHRRSVNRKLNYLFYIKNICRIYIQKIERWRRLSLKSVCKYMSIFTMINRLIYNIHGRQPPKVQLGNRTLFKI